MAIRKSILIKYVFNYDTSTAIPIYLQNFIKALNTLPDSQKPFIYLLYASDAPLEDVLHIEYPYLKLVHQYYWGKSWQRAVNKISRLLLGGNYFYYHGILKYKINCIFPHFGPIDNAVKRQTVAWITDFQQNYYPDFFPQEDRERIYRNIEMISNSGIRLVLSSRSAHADYGKFYPENNNKVVVLRFVSILPEIHEGNGTDIKKKFSINRPYFVISNQFWPHKNHKSVIKALGILKARYGGELPFEVLITGKTSTHRNPTIIQELMSLVRECGVEDTVRFLGFLERQEQLFIIKHAEAVIQPSLFEGWSTLVEECKALNKYILLSDLPVHREQMQKNVSFFDPMAPGDLADAIEKFLNERPVIESFNYRENIEVYARDILNLFQI